MRYLDWVKKYRFPIASILLLLSAVFIFQWAKPIEEKPIDAPNTLIYSEKQASVIEDKNNLLGNNQKQVRDTPSVFQGKNLDKIDSLVT